MDGPHCLPMLLPDLLLHLRVCCHELSEFNCTSHLRYRGDHTYHPRIYGYAYEIGLFCCKGEVKVVRRSLRRAIRSPSMLPQEVRDHNLKQGGGGEWYT